MERTALSIRSPKALFLFCLATILSGIARRLGLSLGVVRESDSDEKQDEKRIQQGLLATLGFHTTSYGDSRIQEYDIPFPGKKILAPLPID